MIRTLVTVAFIIAFYFIFYLFAMARAKERIKMDERVRALFDLSAEESANRRTGQKKQRKNYLQQPAQTSIFHSLQQLMASQSILI